jgi:hypothetical protein
MIDIIASIHGDVIRTLGPVWHCECELLHTASDLFIGHKSLRCPPRSRDAEPILTCSRHVIRHFQERMHYGLFAPDVGVD